MPAVATLDLEKCAPDTQCKYAGCRKLCRGMLSFADQQNGLATAATAKSFGLNGAKDQLHGNSSARIRPDFCGEKAEDGHPQAKGSSGEGVVVFTPKEGTNHFATGVDT